jgi:hypothetical protein
MHTDVHCQKELLRTHTKALITQGVKMADTTFDFVAVTSTDGSVVTFDKRAALSDYLAQVATDEYSTKIDLWLDAGSDSIAVSNGVNVDYWIRKTS